ncbi:hypothetical protein NDU88_002569 [Pleurodeles waltl]|uniref:Uncharacterized protein n=1 Tax=Pleurodeles waltl TaxID=8319 RepID=A0AAV7UYY7_PLEWA|nr:hypothetical protein NDU88_002569 [Pleurodeles waltl]
MSPAPPRLSRCTRGAVQAPAVRARASAEKLRPAVVLNGQLPLQSASSSRRRVPQPSLVIVLPLPRCRKLRPPAPSRLQDAPVGGAPVGRARRGR